MERIRKDFVINVSHELRTPLASIQGYTETLLDGALADPVHNVRFLSIIRQNAERLARLTEDLLTLSRIEMRRQRFQFASYYVQRLLNDAADSLRPLAEKKKIGLTVENVTGELEVFCDAEAVYQVLSNLIDNAVKYTPEGRSITIGAQSLTEGGKDLVEFFRPRHRHRHPRIGPGAAVRAVLPGGQGTLAGVGWYRAWPGDRQASLHRPGGRCAGGK